MTERQARAFERGVPGARVLRWPRASHYLFLTRPADVIKKSPRSSLDCAEPVQQVEREAIAFARIRCIHPDRTFRPTTCALNIAASPNTATRP